MFGSTVLPFAAMEEGEKCTPTYDLERVKSLVRTGRYSPTSDVLTSLIVLKLDEDDLVACILGLEPAVFYKSMPSKKMIGTWQDVYRPTYQGRRLYVKVRISDDARTIVIQLKRR
jgi:hypothetical protein